MSTALAADLYSPTYRAASLRQVAVQRLQQGIAGLWTGLEAYAFRRAAPHLARAAVNCEAGHPEVAAELRRLATAR